MPPGLSPPRNPRWRRDVKHALCGQNRFRSRMGERRDARAGSVIYTYESDPFRPPLLPALGSALFCRCRDRPGRQRGLPDRKGRPVRSTAPSRRALKYYLPALEMEPDNVDRIARQYRHLLSDTPDKTEKLR